MRARKLDVINLRIRLEPFTRLGEDKVIVMKCNKHFFKHIIYVWLQKENNLWNIFVRNGLRFKLLSQTPLIEILLAAQSNDITTEYNRKKTTAKTLILNYCSHHPLTAQSSYN